MLNWEFERFISEWMNRANGYNDDQNGCYDKFFTLFVVFNRMYSEATFELERRGAIKLQKNRPLPDKKGATEYTLEMIGLDNFNEMYESHLREHVEAIEWLIENQVFSIRLSFPEGRSQPDKDLELLNKIRSSGKTRALAILELIYSVRCNLFHGHKGFEPIQQELLQPINIILEHTVERLHQSLINA